MKTQIIIVGQGLAGTLLSYHLYKNNIQHLVIDQAQANTASKVAAGLINPIGIKRMVKSWNVDTYLPYAKTIYNEIENLIGETFFSQIPMNKIYGEKDPEFWQHRIEAGQLQDYVELNPQSTKFPESVNAPFGYGQIKQGGRLNMTKFLSAYRQFLSSHKLLIEENFNDDDATFFPNWVEWKNIKAEKVIFCRGEQDSNSNFFSKLNFRNTKGQLLDTKIEGLKTDEIILKGIFVLPVDQSEFKIGATFEHHWDNMAPTTEMKDELVTKWNKISNLLIHIKKQLTGIRPTMHDRRPVVGFIPKQQNLGIFNGLGSRGGLLAPYLANEMVKMILDQTYKTYPEVMVNRYFKKA